MGGGAHRVIPGAEAAPACAVRHAATSQSVLWVSPMSLGLIPTQLVTPERRFLARQKVTTPRLRACKERCRTHTELCTAASKGCCHATQCTPCVDGCVRGESRASPAVAALTRLCRGLQLRAHVLCRECCPHAAGSTLPQQPIHPLPPTRLSCRSLMAATPADGGSDRQAAVVPRGQAESDELEQALALRRRRRPRPGAQHGANVPSNAGTAHGHYEYSEVREPLVKVARLHSHSHQSLSRRVHTNPASDRIRVMHTPDFNHTRTPVLPMLPVAGAAAGVYVATKRDTLERL
jgi:hypothetical protein